MKKKQKYILLGAIIIIGVIVIAWILYGKYKYLTNSKYCIQDSDCVMDGSNCDAVNKYHYNEISGFQCAWEEQPIPCCRNNVCTLCGGESLDMYYCEQDSDCLPYCGGFLHPRLPEIRIPVGRGDCVNKDYTWDSAPDLNLACCVCENIEECNACSCLNNHCVTHPTGELLC